MSRWTWTLGLLAAGCTTRPAAPPVEARVAPLALPAPAPHLDPAPDAVRVRLTAERTSEAPLRYAYNGQRPGPVIRAKVGDRLTVELTNGLAAPTTIHWHGVQVPWAMDGVSWMGAPVPAGGQFSYEFNLLHPGTFWYHPHFDTEKQVDAGLYGLLIVDDPAEPAADDEVLLVFDADDEHRPATDDLPDGDPGRPAHGHGGRAARWTVNGEAGPVQWTGRGGQRVRVRMLNASNTGYLALTWPGLRQIAGDQGLLPAPQTPDVVVLAPGDRAEFEWLLGREGFTLDRLPWSLNGGRTYAEAEPLVDVVVEAPADAPAPLALPYPGGAPSADPPYSDLIYTFSGSDRTGVWLINGERFPDVTIDSVAVGQRPVLEIRNVSASHHPFHIHGMRFEILSIDGAPPPYRRVEDTIDVGIRQRVRVQLWPDEPGDWMAHCHLLPHADDGMMTVLRVRP